MSKPAQRKFSEFEPANPSDWEVAAREELKGEDPWKKLTHQVSGISIRPIYSPEDQKNEKPLLASDQKSFLGARTWYNCPHLLVENPKIANEAALLHLKNGADGIYFELSDSTSFDVLLQGIDPRYCSLNFLAMENAEAHFNAYNTLLRQRNYAESLIPGAFIENFNSHSQNLDIHLFSGIQIPYQAIPAKEIAVGLHALLAVRKKLPGNSRKALAISIKMDLDFFLSIAKLRAFRQVWNQIGGGENSPLFIHACSPVWAEKKIGPNENMLSGTTAALAAILGGCDVLTVEPAGDSLSTRIARNISNILRDESHLSKVADPVAGSWFVETLTRQMSEQALRLVEVIKP